MGADLFYQALKKGAGVGVVEYSLPFDTRLPAMHVYAHCDSNEVKDVVMTYTTSEETAACGGRHLDRGPPHVHQRDHGVAGADHAEHRQGVRPDQGRGRRGAARFAFGKMDDWLKDHFLKGGASPPTPTARTSG